MSSRGDALPATALIATEGILSAGGIEAFVSNLAEGLEERGWGVSRIVTSYRGDGFERAAARRRCHDLTELPLGISKVIAAARQVNAILPDALILNHCPLLHWALPFLRRRIRTIAVLHSDDPAFYRTAALQSGRIFRWVAPSLGLFRRFPAFIGARQRPRLRLLPHGVDEQQFAAAPFAGRRQESIAFIGYLGVNKGAHLLPAIMTDVWSQRPAATLAIVGSGPMGPHLRTEFLRMEAGARVSFRGTLGAAGVSSVLAESMILLSPTAVEGFGLALVEAMMCGVVPVVSRVPLVTDWVVSPGISGLVLDTLDASEFARAVCSLLGDPQALQTMSEAAQASARERFSLRRMAAGYEALLSEEHSVSESRAHALVRFGWDAIRLTATRLAVRARS